MEGEIIGTQLMTTGVNDECFELFKTIIKPLQNTVRGTGYSLAVHGSLNRDIDLVLVPWEEICIPENAVFNKVIGLIKKEFGQVKVLKCPYDKPHGRHSWAIILDKKAYIDLSIMPQQGA